MRTREADLKNVDARAAKAVGHVLHRRKPERWNVGGVSRAWEQTSVLESGHDRESVRTRAKERERARERERESERASEREACVPGGQVEGGI